MTTWGLISDVHGNLPALREALAALRAHGADRFAFLGDYLGRGDSDGCVALIRSVADAAIVGNRDLDWQDRVCPEARAWVLDLPRRVVQDGLLLTHGDPRLTRALSTAETKRGFRGALAEMDAVGAVVWAFGHSHHARIWQLGDPPSESFQVTPRERVALRREARYALNVGTTGMPFPGRGGPSVAAVSLDDGWLEIVPLAWHSVTRARPRSRSRVAG